MHCNEVNPLLPFLAEGTLDSSRSEELERHVEGCHSCAGQLASLKAALLAVHDSAAPEVKATDWFGVREEAQRRVRTRKRLLLFSLCAAGVTVLVGTFFLLGVRISISRNSLVVEFGTHDLRRLEPVDSPRIAKIDGLANTLRAVAFRLRDHELKHDGDLLWLARTIDAMRAQDAEQARINAEKTRAVNPETFFMPVLVEAPAEENALAPGSLVLRPPKKLRQ
jgi:hypothetical protein